ncbi:MAG: Crp/Fnr family transcriptional regulator [Gemmiger sp.]
MDLSPFYPLLRTTPLMRGLSDEDLDQLLPCLDPRVRKFSKGEILLLAGDPAHEAGILLDGQITAAKSTPDGSDVTVTRMGPGGVFADVLSGSSQKSPVTITAETDCTALYLPYERVMSPCRCLHPAHLQLLRNLILTISDKYFALDQRLELLICKSLRERIAIWLLDEAKRAESDTFETSMTRSALAQYLNCDRSALSRELGRMQREGLIECWRGSFKILDKNRLRAQKKER